MKSLFPIVLLAAAVTAVVVSNEVPEVVEVTEGVEGDEVADVDLKEMPIVLVTAVDELTEAFELMDEDELIDETAVASRLSLSSISSAILVYSTEVREDGTANHTLRRDIRVTITQPIRAIRVTRLGTSQDATPSFVNGGIEQTFVTIRIQSAIGRGYHYRIQVYF